MAEEVKVSRGKIIAGAVFVFLGAMIVGNMTGGEPEPETQAAAPVADAKASVVYKIPVTMTQPAKGPEDALVTIVQWCDFPDQGCLAAEPTLEELLKRYPKELRLVFRHFATQNGPSSQLAHQFSVGAAERAGKFWEARALLFAHQGEFTYADAERYAGQLGLNWPSFKRDLEANTFAGPVASDRIFAHMFEVKQAPGFFANGRPLQGAPTKQALTTLVERELDRAKKTMAGGVERSALYAELTKNGVWISPKDAPK